MKTRMFRHAIAWLAILAAPLAAEVKVFKGFTLIDGTGGTPAAGWAMIVANGRISWVGPTAKLKVPTGAETIDLTGKFVMPGIINLHCHLGNVVDLTQDKKFYTRENVEKDLKTYTSYGVTTVLSMGTDQDLIFRIRDEQRATGRPSMTRVYTAGQGFAFKGGYGGLPGVTFSLQDTSEVDKDVAELAKKKVDIVKMWVDDHMGHMKKMPFEIAKAIVDSGHNHSLPVAAHIFYLDDAKKLAGAGVNGFAHSVRDKPVDQELIDSMKRNGTWLAAPTLSREASTFIYAKPAPFLNDPFFTRSVSPKVLATLKSADYQKEVAADPDFPKLPGALEVAKKNLKKLSGAGVKYAFGTDAGPPGRFPGYFEQWEMELMVDAGLTPSQVIRAATKSAAEFLHAKDLGTLELGKWADLIVLDADPLKNIRNTRTIQSVYIAGNRVAGGK
jgi:imidazolonepropionase-like amidohydrolase